MNRASRLERLHIPIPLPVAGLVLLAGLYVFVGLFGHDPWKPEDAIGIGIVHQMLNSASVAHWLIPRLAGEIYLDDGPLYYVLAALCAELLAFILPVHEGARLASALSIAAALWFVRQSANLLFAVDEQKSPGGAAIGDGSALLLIGMLGLFVHAHGVLAENGALAGGAMAWYGFARSPTAPARAGVWFGAGLGIVLWSKGFAPAIPLLTTAALAPLISSRWRSAGQARFLGIGVVMFLIAAMLWYAVLHAQGSGLFSLWWDRQWADSAPSGSRLLEQLQLLSWSTWPAWPLAVGALWDRRHRLNNDPIVPVMAGACAALVEFAMSPQLNEVYAMPLMLPLALAAGAGAPALRRGASNAFAWFGAMTFSVLGLFVWVGWFAMMTNVPARLARNFYKLEPGFIARFDATALTMAMILTLLWLILLWRSTRSVHRSSVFWAGGITLIWGLAMTLWLPWIDYGKSYRPVALSLLSAVRKSGGQCIVSRGLGEAQRAAFHYHAGIITRRLEAPPSGAARSCPLLLVQADTRQKEGRRPGPGWRLVWEGSRPRDQERYHLYARK